MARLLRIYEKKRGHRRTGSRTLGTLGESLFFGFFLCVGLVACVLVLLGLVWPEWRANRHFVAARCTVLDSTLSESRGGDGTTYRPDVRIRFRVDGRTYEAVTYDITRLYSSNRAKSEEAVHGFRPGRQYDCWYDPLNPARAVLVRGYSGWLYMLLLIPLSFIVIGGGGLVYNVTHWGRSAERRAAVAQRGTTIDLFEQEPDVHPDFPAVPSDVNLRNSPGTTLAYRLAVATAPAWRLFALLVACALWNGIASIFVGMAIHADLYGTPNWLLTLFIAPFALAGIGLLIYSVRQLLMITGVGVTRVEISDYRLCPGGRYDLFLSQQGRLKVQTLEVSLACDERATYHQGTDARTEVRRVFERGVFQANQFEIVQGAPYEQRCVLDLPPDAMHSFQADHNEINWKLVVRGHADGWPPFERVFPLIVLPGSSAAAL